LAIGERKIVSKVGGVRAEWLEYDYEEGLTASERALKT